MAGCITLVTGGARSGKSAFAEQLCMERGAVIGYIATAQALDEGMADRIKKHQQRRPDSWHTFEKTQNVHELFDSTLDQSKMQTYDVFLLDCLTVLTTNIMLKDHNIDWDTVSRTRINEIENQVLDQLEKLIKVINENNHDVIIVTNEVGLGIIPENRLARVFRDIAGKANERIAKEARDVHFVVSGIPMKIKG